MRDHQKGYNKRSGSPLEAPKTLEISDRKKKSSSNTQLGSAYKKGIKEFETYGKTEKKKSNNYLKELLRNNGESTNKYRIVTEPVEDRLLYLGNNNYGQAGTGVKGSSSKKKYELQQPEYVDKYLKLNIRTNNNSKEKLRTGDSFHRLEGCSRCDRYKEQLESLRKEMGQICMDKILWKSGQLSIEEIRQSLKQRAQDDLKKSTFKSPVVKDLQDIRKHFLDLMKDVESLSTIDYPKMLSLNVFKNDDLYSESPSHQQQELKELLGQLRNSIEGKVGGWDLQDIDCGAENEHTQKIMRNLKCRLSFYLRENLGLRLKKQILERSEEITAESEDYLKKVIEDVLVSYADRAVY